MLVGTDLRVETIGLYIYNTFCRHTIYRIRLQSINNLIMRMVYVFQTQSSNQGLFKGSNQAKEPMPFSAEEKCHETGNISEHYSQVNRHMRPWFGGLDSLSLIQALFRTSDQICFHQCYTINQFLHLRVCVAYRTELWFLLVNKICKNCIYI